MNPDYILRPLGVDLELAAQQTDPRVGQLVIVLTGNSVQGRADGYEWMWFMQSCAPFQIDPAVLHDVRQAIIDGVKGETK